MVISSQAIRFGQDGWLEKPLAYIVLTRRDPAIDTVPAVTMDMQFTDQTGPVTLAVASNTPLVASGEAAVRRNCDELEVSQLVDVRAVEDGAGGDDTVTLEVRMRGKGVVPDVREALAGLDAPLAGYTLAKDGIVADPPIVLASADASMSPMMMSIISSAAASSPAAALSRIAARRRRLRLTKGARSSMRRR